MAEKRKYKRVNIKSVAEVALPDGDFDQAYIGGISRGGLEMYTGKEMKKDQSCKITLHFLYEGREMIETTDGRIKWSASFKNAFVSGVEFTKVLNAQENPNLLSYIQKAESF